MLITLLALLPAVSSTKAQEYSALDSVEISFVTCEPYDVVYALYGHTAIRINDWGHGDDLIVNYGVFDKSKPNFILNFIFGITDYTMAFVPMERFLLEYSYFGCYVKEQVLNLTNEEKDRIIRALSENYLPENREYRYNYFFNNCTTKARDIIVNNIDSKLTYETTGMQQGERSFRQLIHWKNRDFPWAAWGNDMLLGLECDRTATFEEREFLPEIMMEDFDKAVKVMPDGTHQPFVKATNLILAHAESQAEPMSSFPLTPSQTAMVLFVLIAAYTLFERKRLPGKAKVFDYVFLSLFGTIGILITAMLFSEHPTVRCNFHIFLFNPLWFVIAWQLHRRKWAPYLAFVLLVMFAFCGFFQSYAEGCVVLALSLLVRVVNVLYEKK